MKRSERIGYRGNRRDYTGRLRLTQDGLGRWFVEEEYTFYIAYDGSMDHGHWCRVTNDWWETENGARQAAQEYRERLERTEKAQQTKRIVEV